MKKCFTSWHWHYPSIFIAWTILKETPRCASGGNISTEISGGASTFQHTKKTTSFLKNRKWPETNRLATHLFTNPNNHYPARAITVVVSSLMTGLALPMNQKSLRKDIESPGGFVWKFKNHFHHNITVKKLNIWKRS